MIDFGNNARFAFGQWESYINWQEIFLPNSYLEALAPDDEIEKNFHYQMPEHLRVAAKTEDVSFDEEDLRRGDPRRRAPQGART